MRFLNEPVFFRQEFFNEYRPILAVEGFLFLAAVLSWILTGNRLGFAAVVLVSGCLLLTIWFFRDPPRVTPSDDDIAVSPADGKIVNITGPEFDAECGQNVCHISIFLRIWDVHVNRYPVSGTVVKRICREGCFHPAMFEKSSEENEQCVVVLMTDKGFVKIRQIAGIIARRIVCRSATGDRAEMGQAFGLIKFGSRVEVSLPAAYAVHVHKGQKVYSGETVIGKLADA